MLLQPVQKLVATSIFVEGKNVSESLSAYHNNRRGFRLSCCSFHKENGNLLAYLHSVHITGSLGLGADAVQYTVFVQCHHMIVTCSYLHDIP